MTKKLTDKHVERYLEAHDLAPTTQNLYRGVLRRFVAAARPLSGGWERRCADWRGNLRCGPCGKALYLRIARGFLRWCVEERLIARNPLEGMRLRAPTSTSRQALSAEEVRHLFDTIRAECGTGPWSQRAFRDYAIVSFMLYTGVRVSGARGLDVEDFRRSKARVLAHYKCKGHAGKDAFVVVPAPTSAAIAEYLVTTGRDWSTKGPLFLTCGKRSVGSRMRPAGFASAIVRRMEAAGIRRPGISIHSFRHTAATMAYKATKDVMAVRDMLGHKNLATTQGYLHSLGRIEEAAELAIDYGESR